MDLNNASLVITVALAFIGYLITYWYNVRLANRKEQLDLVNKRINEFYGPLYIASQAGNKAYAALLLKLHRKDSIFGRGGETQIPDEKVLAEWRIWMESVFMPLNEVRERLILENAHLIREEKLPECLLQFVTHVSAYKATLRKWQMGEFTDYVPLVDFPVEVDKYASWSYQELKREQLRLIGKRSWFRQLLRRRSLRKGDALNVGGGIEKAQR